MPLDDSTSAVWYSTTSALSSFLKFIPTLIGAIIVLAIGWALSGLLARVVHTGLNRLGCDRAAAQAGIDNFLHRAGTKWSASKVVAELTKWFVFLIFVQAAAGLLAMPQLTAVINSIVLFIPNVVVAMAILVAGALIAKFVSGLVRGSVSELGVANPDVLSKLTYAGIMTVAVMATLDQLGVAETIVQTLFIGMVGAVSLATGLAFGLGGRDVAGRIAHSWYDNSRMITERAKMRESFQPPASELQRQTPATYEELPSEQMSSSTAGQSSSLDAETKAYRQQQAQMGSTYIAPGTPTAPQSPSMQQGSSNQQMPPSGV